MNEASYVTALVVLGAIIVPWAVGQVVKRAREPLAVERVLVVRTGLGLLFALSSAQTVIVGGGWLLLAPILVILALWSFGLVAAIIWWWVRGELKGHAPVASDAEGGDRIENRGPLPSVR